MTESAALVAQYDQVIFDLDGVLVLGDEAVPGGPEAVAQLEARGIVITYVTNNASRSAEAVATLLSSLGMAATGAQVLTSAQGAARVLADGAPAGSPILVLGAEALAQEVVRVGLRPVRTAAENPAAVVQGFGPDVGWGNLAEACIAIRSGATWVATNADRTLPTPRGPLPGNGALVAVLATALDRQPDVIVGKPAPTLFRQAAGNGPSPRRPLVVGDRLDTDIAGARQAGLDSMLVLTGVSRAVDLIQAPPPWRPTYVSRDLGGLFAPAAPLSLDPVDLRPGPNGGTISARPRGGSSWRIATDRSPWLLDGEGPEIGALVALCRAWWALGGGTELPMLAPAGPAARAALESFELV